MPGAANDKGAKGVTIDPVPDVEMTLSDGQPAKGKRAPGVDRERSAMAAAPQWHEMDTREKVSHVKTEVLIGIIIFLSQLPESVAFAFLASMTPPTALHSAWIIGFITSAFGGRPGMISGAAGARATIIGSFLGTPDRVGQNGEGVEIVFPSVIISGGFMLLIWATKFYRYTKLIPESVLVGFLNGLGLLIILSQVYTFRNDDDTEWRTGAELGWMLLITFVSWATMEFTPKLPCRFSSLVPSSLLALVMGAIVEFALVRPLGARTDTIGDVAEFTPENAYPVPFMIDPQYDLARLNLPGVPTRIFVLSILLCAVGSIESLLTAEVVTEVVKTPNRPDKVMSALGVANVIAGFLGGMGGDATIGLSKMNVISGGTSRISGVVASIGVVLSVTVAYPALNLVPMSALTGVMLVVGLHTFSWPSIPYAVAACLPEAWRAKANVCGRQLLPVRVDRYDALIMVVVSVISYTTNIVYGIFAGVVLACFRFSWESSHDFKVQSGLRADGSKLYTARGELFFATANKFHLEFDYVNDPERVALLLEYEPQDYSAVHAIRKVMHNYEKAGKQIEVRIHGADKVGGEKAPNFEETMEMTEEWHRARPVDKDEINK